MPTAPRKTHTRKAADRFEDAGRNRSLLRGLALLRAFRPGTDLLGNGELAERTGLAPATVSRLTQTLVQGGFLEYEETARAYRLAPAVLSLGHAMRATSPVLQTAVPLMRAASTRLKVSVGLACADGAEMVYLESVRYNRRASLRTIVAGQRVPVELTSLGRAYLATLADDKRTRLLEAMRAHHRPASWRQIESEIQRAVKRVATDGFCAAAWQPQVVAIATPLALSAHRVLILNFSLQTDDDTEDVVREHAQALLGFKQSLRRALVQSG